MLRSRVVRIVLCVIGLVSFYAVGLFVREQCGIAIIIHNASGKSLRQMKVRVEPTGRVISVGDLANEKGTRVFVRPQTESHISLEYLDASGQPHADSVVGYVEAGYCGKAEVTVLPDDRVGAKETIDVLMCWGGWLDFL